MPKNKKQFIDKKSAVTFSLVHRSQHDPLQADEEASKGVLVSHMKKDERKEKEQKFGVYFDDDYNYLQHLRDVRELSQVEPTDVYRLEVNPVKTDKKRPGIMLPASALPSTVETKEGLLNKGVTITGPQPSWDPDIVAALDDDFDYENPENTLDDDFIVKAMAEGQENTVNMNSDDEDDSGDGYASDEADFSGSEDGFFDQYADPLRDEETRSRFTEYSMSSSVVPRSEALTLVDDRFEKLYEAYDEDAVGPLDEEEIEGFHEEDHSQALLNSVLAEFEKEQQEKVIHMDEIKRGEAQPLYFEDVSESRIDIEIEDTPNKAEWDCESILSTYSTLYNHPKFINEPKKIRLTSRLGVPDDVLPQRGPTRRQQEEEEHRPMERVPTYRPKDESTEERKERKQSIKTERKARRVEKKANKTAFKDEEQKQHKVMLNVKQALQGVHIQ